MIAPRQYQAIVLPESGGVRATVRLHAWADTWETEVLSALAALMERHGIERLSRPWGRAELEIVHVPMEWLPELVTELQKLGFAVQRPGHRN